jgi:hypothetical protein
MKAVIRVFVFVSLFFSIWIVSAVAVPSTSLVISQLYVGAGSGDAQPRYEYVELFNKGTASVSLAGWSLQYAVEGVNTWQAFPLSGSVAPGQYYLIRANAAGGNASFPQADLTISLSIPVGVGKFALVNDATAIATGCSTETRVIDEVGYGTTACYEGTVIPAQSELRAYWRKGGGCTDSDNNNSDFLAVSPIPHNTSSSRNFCGGTAGTRTFTLQDRGSTSFQSTGSASAITTGFTRIQPDAGTIAPTGLAIYGLRQGGTLITETGVPVSRLITTGLTYIEISGATNTGLAIANPNSQSVTFDYTTDDSNNTLTNFSGSIVIPPNSQIATFLNEMPFAIRPQSGTMTFFSSLPVAVTALRGFTNERGEFLVSTLPILDPTVAASSIPTYLPHFAASGGWRTELVLVNTTGVAVSGTVSFFDTSGNPMTVAVGSVTVSSVDYSVPSKRTVKFALVNSGSTVQTGLAKITPTSGDRAPVPLGIFSYTFGGARVTEAAVAGLRGTEFRTYVENSGTPGGINAIQSGFAIGNAESTTATVSVEVFRTDGSSTGLTNSITIPVNAKVARFTNELFPTLPASFKGTMRLTSSSNLSVVGLRSHINERGDFLITTLPASLEQTAGSASEIVFPHIVDGGGYTTQFILFNGVKDLGTSGTLLFRTTGGQLLDLTLQ